MDSRQEIGLGASVAASQAYASSTQRSEEAPKSEVSSNAVQGAGNAGSGSGNPGQATINPRTVLDPDLYVNVAQYSYGNGAVEFQVPSKSQLDAYRRNQDADAAQAETTQVETSQRVADVQESGDGDGVGDQSTAATGTVAAAAVSQTQAPPPPVDTQRNGTAEGNRTSPGETRRTVNLDA